MDAGLTGIAGSYLHLKGQNLMETVQASLLRKSLDHQTQTMGRLLEAVSEIKINPPHLGQKIDISA